MNSKYNEEVNKGKSRNGNLATANVSAKRRFIVKSNSNSVQATVARSEQSPPDHENEDEEEEKV